MIKEFHFEKKKKQEAEGYDRQRNSNSNLREAGVIAFSNIGNVRQANEDDWGIAKTSNGLLFVVCDGMGGHAGGQMASSLAVESIIEYLKKEKYSNPIQALNEALQFANTQILGYATQHPELKGMGTTACILLLQDDEAYIAHVGDSRIYLYLGKEKELHRITKDHSYVQSLVDKWDEGIKKGISEQQLRNEGFIPDSEVESHPNKNRILKALGIKPELQPTFNYQNKAIFPKNGDIFLICSDGLTGMISDSTIQSVLSQNIPIEQKGEMLINLALEGENGQSGGQDNITVELIQIDSSPWKESKFKSYNPNSKPNLPIPNSGKLKKIVKWATVAAIVLLLGFSAWFGLEKYKEVQLGKQIKIAQEKINQTEIDYKKIYREYQIDSTEVANLEKDAGTPSNRIEIRKNTLNEKWEKVKEAQKEVVKADSVLQTLKNQKNESNNNRKSSR